MKKIQYLLSSLFVLTLLLSACNMSVSDTPPTIPAPQTIAPATKISSTPTLQTVALDVPTIGSTISWFDTSTLVYVPEGEFIMGADEPQEQDFNPAHTVALDEFWIYSTKVTSEMYNLCISAGQCTPPVSDSTVPASTLSGTSIILSGSDPTDLILKDFPITNLTWEQANTYCQWAGGRLPTEAEWEKTARGTESQNYPWGEAEPSCDLLNFGGCGGFLSGVLDHPDGMSEYKALDMAGNAYEWISDWYQADYYAQSRSANPIGPETGIAHSVRGSSFESDSNSVQSYKRASLEPGQKKIDLGFRCVVEDPTIFAPMCQAPAQMDMSANAPQPGQSSSGSSGSSTNTISVDLNSLIPRKIASYCVDKKSNLGGALLVDDFSQYEKFILSSNCSIWMYYVYYNDPPKVVTGGQNKWPIFETTYVGPEGTYIEIKPGLSCTTLKQPPSPPSQGVPAVCAPGYTLQSNGSCLYTGTPVQAGGISCPLGYTYTQDAECCTLNPAQAGLQPIQYPACGPGNIYDPQQLTCYKPSSTSQAFIANSTPITFNLGTCDDKKSNDKPQQPQPCTIDPATGACN